MKTLQNVWGDLRPKERELILTLVRQMMPEMTQLHLGVLPFLPAAEAVLALQLHYNLLAEGKRHFTGERFLKQLISKIQR